METEERIIDLTNRLETISEQLGELLAAYSDDRYVMGWREEDTLIRAYQMLRWVVLERKEVARKKEVR